MKRYALDYYGFSNEDGDGCMAVFLDFPDVKGVGDTFEEARTDAYEQLEEQMKKRESKMISIFDRAMAAYDSRSYQEAYGLFEQAALIEPKAMINLAFMHMKGTGCERSVELAQTWFERAADQGNTYALNSLGALYEQGMLGKADEAKALEYYRKAADAGHVDAQLKSGMLLRQSGKHTEAMRYLITAAHNNNAQAQGIITYVSNAGVSNERNALFRSLDPSKQQELIENLIKTKIRPALAADEGGVELLNFIPGQTPQIWLNYQGACSGCHLGSTSTADMMLGHFETLIDKNVVMYLM